MSTKKFEPKDVVAIGYNHSCDKHKNYPTMGLATCEDGKYRKHVTVKFIGFSNDFTVIKKDNIDSTRYASFTQEELVRSLTKDPNISKIWEYYKDGTRHLIHGS